VATTPLYAKSAFNRDVPTYLRQIENRERPLAIITLAEPARSVGLRPFHATSRSRSSALPRLVQLYRNLATEHYHRPVSVEPIADAFHWTAHQLTAERDLPSPTSPRP